MRSLVSVTAAVALVALVSSAALADAPPTFELKWGTQGTGDGQFDSPVGFAASASGYVYVADSNNHRIQYFTADGDYVGKWGSLGNGDGQLDHPWRVAVGAGGFVYVADMDNRRIQKFTSAGGFVTKWGSVGSGNGQFNTPTGVAVDAAGNVYVVDTYNYRIQKFTSDGTFLTKWGSQGTGDGQFVRPYGIATGGGGYVYVADTAGHRIQKFTSDGTFLTKWGSQGTGDGQFSSPMEVAVDTAGDVYVSDTANHRIQKFSETGAFLTKWGSQGAGDGQFNVPHKVEVDASGHLYVADSANHRIQRFLACSCGLTTVYPNGGETLIAGTLATIAWSSTACCDSTVRLELLCGGTTCLVIADSTENDGSYEWLVSACGSAIVGYRLRVSSPDGATGDQSDDDFVIAPSFRILSVLDVGNDQGRQVRIRWYHNSQDQEAGSPTIVSYSIWRRIDAYLLAGRSYKLGAVGRGAAYPPGDWDFVKAVPAHAEETYSTLCETLCDSTVAGPCWSAFFVRAETEVPAVYFDTPPDSGYSIDNLAPAKLLDVHYTDPDSSILAWNEAPEVDFSHYSVYASNSETFDVGTALLGVTTSPAPAAMFRGSGMTMSTSLPRTSRATRATQ